MPEDIVSFILREGERERDVLLARGKERALQIMDEARTLAREVAEQSVPRMARQPSSPLLREKRGELMTAYGRLMELLSAEIGESWKALPQSRRSGLWCALVGDALARLGPGGYRVLVPPDAMEAIRCELPGDYEIEWIASDETTAKVTSLDGRVEASFDLALMVANYLETRRNEVDEWIFGDEL